MKILILTGGTVDRTFTLERIHSEKYDIMIAVDRGCEFFLQENLTPSICVGDFDSISSDRYKELINNQTMDVKKYPKEKDWTDTELAINIALDYECSESEEKKIEIIGGTGTRLDHVLGNIELLKLCTSRHVEAAIIDPHNRIRLIDKEIEIKKEEQFGFYVSAIPFTEEVKGVDEIGFKYPLTDFSLKNGCTLGISNEIIDKIGTIRIKDGLLLVIESID